MNFTKSYNWFLTSALLFWASISGISQSCSIQGPISILDADTTQLTIVVEGALNQTIGENGQGICAVQLEFEHGYVADLLVELISPSGQSVILLGPPTTNSSATPNITWDVDFLPCGFPVSPDPGFSGNWNNIQPWAILSSYDGSYHPFFGCFEDFDGSDVNGNWTIRFFDDSAIGEGVLLNFSIIFCDGNGLDCSICDAVGGDIDEVSLAYCEGDPNLNFTILPQYNGQSPSVGEFTTMHAIQNSDGQIISISPFVDLTNSLPGDYKVNVFNILTDQVLDLPQVDFSFGQDSIESMFFNGALCGAFATGCTSIEVYDVPDTTYLNEVLCEGESFILDNEVYNVEGSYIATLTNGQCDSIVQLDLEVIVLEAQIDESLLQITCDAPSLILKSGGSIVDDVTTYHWTTTDGLISGPNGFPDVEISAPGEYILELSDRGCISKDTVIVEDFTIPSIINIEPAILSCTQTIVSLEAMSDDNIIGYSWEGPLGETFVTQEINIDIPGWYNLESTNEYGCVSLDSVEVTVDYFLDIPSFSVDTLTCDSISVTIETSIDNQMDYAFSWTNAQGFLSQVASPNVTQAGTYILEITGVNGCVESHIVDVEIDVDIPEVSIEQDTIRCLDPEAMFELQIEPGDNITWTDPSISGTSFTTTNTGFYPFQIESSNGCVLDSFIQVVTEVSVPDFTLNDTEINCQDSILLQHVFTNTDQNSVFSWTGPFGFQSMEQDPYIYDHGQYILEVTNENGCLYIDTLFVFQGNLEPDVTFLIDTITCQNPNADVSVSGGQIQFSYNWSGPNGFESVNQNINVIQGGTYAVTITDQNTGCSARSAIVVQDDREEIEIELFSDVLTCSSDPSEVYFQTEESIAWSEWSNETGLLSTMDTLFTNQEGVYYLTIELADSGCQYVDSVEVLSDTDQPELIINDLEIGCNETGVTAQIQSNANLISYQWQGPMGFISDESSPFLEIPGNYDVTIQGENECFSSTQFEVLIDQGIPDLSVQGDLFINCLQPQSDIEILSSESIVSYDWEGPQTIGNQAQVSITQAGDYQLTVTASNSCTNEISFTIIADTDLPDFELQTDAISCANNETGLIDLIAVNTDYVYSWTGPNGFASDMEDLVVSEVGIYTVTVSDQQGCTSSQSAEVFSDIQNPVVTNIINPTLDCSNLNATIGVESDDEIDEWNWSGPNGFSFNDQFPLIWEPGLYNVELVDTAGCSTVQEIMVQIDTISPIVQVSGSDINCLENKIELGFSANLSEFEFIWVGPNGFNSMELNPVVDEPGIYELTVVGENGCSTLSSYMVNENFVEPEIQAFDVSLPCSGDAVNLSVSSNDLGTDFKWFGPNNFYSEEQSPLTALLGEYIVVATGANGCISRDTIEVNDIEVPPVFNFSSGTITCDNPTVDLTALFVEDDALVEWHLLDGSVSNNNPYVSSEAGEYKLVVTGLNACKDSVLVNVEIDTIVPTVEILSTQELKCSINEIRLDASGSSNGIFYELFWNTIDGQFEDGTSSYQPLISAPGMYFLQIEDIRNGCLGQDSILVDPAENTLDQINFETQVPQCFGFTNGSISVSSISGGEAPYLFSLNNGLYSTINEFYFLEPGQYSLSVMDSSGCELDTMVTIQNGPDINVSLGPDTLIRLGETINIQALLNIDPADVNDVNWSPITDYECLENSCLEIAITPFETIQLQIEVEDQNGCLDTDIIVVRVEDKSPLYIPNIFSPNGDNNNDLFMVFGGKGVEQIDFIHILDRWGNIVFDRYDFAPEDALFAWDGVYRGRKLQPATFAYIVEYTMINGAIKQEKGTITLIR